MSKLSDAIWVTRKCHINAEKRLNQRSLLANLTLTVYSTYLLVASLISLKITLPQFELVSLTGAVLTLTASVFVWGLRFSERAGQFKASYVRLQLLIPEAKAAEERQDAVALASLQRTYSDILQSCENHSEGDYLKLRFALRAAKEKTVEDMTNIDYVQYFGGLVIGFCGNVLLLVGPALAMYWYVRRL